MQRPIDAGVDYRGGRAGGFRSRDDVSVEVKTGPQVDGWTEIISGLKAGDVVATAANFLLDSESRLNALTETPPSAGASAAGSAP